MSEANNGGRGIGLYGGACEKLCGGKDEAAVGRWAGLTSYFLPLTWG